MTRGTLEKIRCLKIQRDETGVAAVEFALTVPLFALLLVGIVTAGISIKQRSDVREALRAGAHAAMSGEDNLLEIRDVVLRSLNTPRWNDAIAIEQIERCGKTRILGALCEDGTASERYIIIGIDTLAHPSDLGLPTVKETIEVRVR